jgi:hypothetical protein
MFILFKSKLILTNILIAFPISIRPRKQASFRQAIDEHPCDASRIHSIPGETPLIWDQLKRGFRYTR